MQFCPNCSNFLDIGKTSLGSNRQAGGYDSNLESAFNRRTTLKDIDSDDIDNILASEEFSSLDTKKQKNIVKEINRMSKDSSKKDNNTGEYTLSDAFFICYNCFYSQRIESGTKIMSRAPEGRVHGYHTIDRYSNYIEDNTLPRTKNYKCSNNTCPSHKNPADKEAVFFRPSEKSYETWYACTLCNETWKVR